MQLNTVYSVYCIKYPYFMYSTVLVVLNFLQFKIVGVLEHK